MLSPHEILGSGRSDPFSTFSVEKPRALLNELMDFGKSIRSRILRPVIQVVSEYFADINSRPRSCDLLPAKTLPRRETRTWRQQRSKYPIEGLVYSESKESPPLPRLSFRRADTHGLSPLPPDLPQFSESSPAQINCDPEAERGLCFWWRDFHRRSDTRDLNTRLSRDFECNRGEQEAFQLTTKKSTMAKCLWTYEIYPRAQEGGSRPHGSERRP